MPTTGDNLLQANTVEPDRLIDLLTQLAQRLGETRAGQQVQGDAVLQEFSLALVLAEKLCQTVTDKQRLESVLDNMPMSMLQVTPNLSVIAKNQSARAMLERGEYLCEDQHNLCAMEANSHQLLLQLVEHCVRSSEAPMPPTALNLRSVLNPARVVNCFIYPQLRFDFEQQEHVTDICLLVHDQQDAAERSCVDGFAAHHQFTDTETQSLHLLVAGQSVNDIAARRSVSVHTVRTQLKVMLKKAGVSRQALLVQSARQFSQQSSASPVTIEQPAADGSHITLRDGRVLSYFDSGNDQDAVVVHCHGMFTCRLDPLDAALFVQRQVRLIIPERPGYGYSHRRPRHTLVDWASDLLELMDALGIETFTLMAGDFSSAYALAVAHAAPTRVRDVILLEGAAPMDQMFDQFEQGVPSYYMAVFLVARKMPSLVQKACNVAFTQFARDPEKALNRFIEIIGEDNARAVHHPDVYPRILAAVSDAVRQGVTAVVHNQVLMFSDWGFAVQNIKCPVLLCSGDADSLARYHRRRLQALLENSQVVSMPGKGWAAMMYEELDFVLAAWQTSLGQNGLVAPGQ